MCGRVVWVWWWGGWCRAAVCVRRLCVVRSSGWAVVVTGRPQLGELAVWAARHVRTVCRPSTGAAGDVGGDAEARRTDTVVVLESLRFRRARVLSGHTARVWDTALVERPDGRLLLATASIDATVRVWDPDTGVCVRTLTGHTSSVWSVGWVVLPDGRALLATASYDAPVRVWDPDTGVCVRTLTGHTST
ncbi:MAG: hypothetical protein H0V92_08330, partial [Pseudonocardiales bacterium]|nr:hypothetical protein [Pseudonocardiales bacterium]